MTPQNTQKVQSGQQTQVKAFVPHVISTKSSSPLGWYIQITRLSRDV